MDKLNPFLWMLGALLWYFSVGCLLLFVVEGAIYRHRRMIFWGLVSFVPAVLIPAYADWALPTKFFVGPAIASVCYLALLKLGPARGQHWKRVKHRKLIARHVTYHLILATGAFIFILPFGWLLTTSFKEEWDVTRYPPTVIPRIQKRVMVEGVPQGVYTTMKGIKGLPVGVQVVQVQDLEDGTKRVARYLGDTKDGKPILGKQFIVDSTKLDRVTSIGLKWQNFPDALGFLPPQTKKGLLYLWNTVYITVLSIIGTLLSSSLCAYSFARLRWPGRDIMFAAMLATMMIPGAVTMIPVFLIWRTLHCIDTLRPMWMPSFLAGAFSVFLLRQFFMTIPLDLEDAAKIDGCGYLGIYWKIMLPLIKPALAALTIMTFMGSWHSYMAPLIYISTPEKMTLSYGLQVFAGKPGALGGGGGVEMGMLMAGSTMVMLPVLLTFFFTQRYFIQGVTLTGIKG